MPQVPDEDIRNFERVLQVIKQQGDWRPVVIEMFDTREGHDPNGRFMAERIHPHRRGPQYVAGRFCCRRDSQGGAYCFSVIYDLTREQAEDIFLDLEN